MSYISVLSPNFNVIEVFSSSVDIDVENTEQYDFEEVLDKLDSFTGELEGIINDKVASKLGATVQFGSWEDGTFCLMSFYNIDEYKKNKERVKAHLNG